ncbi:hypothetical protein PC115_g21268 [Phytophthora cactorum]|uniref:Uncharacterized protein n=1 Tax=Phytophthora cactorum TaxID=29920 RepID=A0A8T1AMG7_9STRA|nr:hypothetical protein PC115_g21268 [Phytophthora cactorum]
MDMRQLVVRYVDEQLAAEEEGGEQEQIMGLLHEPELIEQGRLRIGCQFGRDLVAPGAQAIQVGVVDVRRQHTT